MFLDPDGLVDPWTQSGPRVTVSLRPVETHWLPDIVVVWLSGVWLVATTEPAFLVRMGFRSGGPQLWLTESRSGLYQSSLSRLGYS